MIQMLQKDNTTNVMQQIIYLLHFLWEDRNTSLHQGRLYSPMETKDYIINVWYFHNPVTWQKKQNYTETGLDHIMGKATSQVHPKYPIQARKLSCTRQSSFLQVLQCACLSSISATAHIELQKDPSHRNDILAQISESNTHMVDLLSIFC